MEKEHIDCFKENFDAILAHDYARGLAVCEEALVQFPWNYEFANWRVFFLTELGRQEAAAVLKAIPLDAVDDPEAARVLISLLDPQADSSAIKILERAMKSRLDWGTFHPEHSRWMCGHLDRRTTGMRFPATIEVPEEYRKDDPWARYRAMLSRPQAETA
ncbi:MAG: tetratricopeptide repeat protein [Elusimicrobiota bacterium]|jgi:hypothetical protein